VTEVPAEVKGLGYGVLPGQLLDVDGEDGNDNDDTLSTSSGEPIMNQVELTG
jgi:hypothetical protein